MLLKSSHVLPMQLSFGDWFLLRRRSQQLSQGDIAKALQVTSQTVSNWEKGKSVPSLDPDQFFKLCQLLDISMEDFAAAYRGEIDTSS